MQNLDELSLKQLVQLKKTIKKKISSFDNLKNTTLRLEDLDLKSLPDYNLYFKKMNQIVDDKILIDEKFYITESIRLEDSIELEDSDISKCIYHVYSETFHTELDNFQKYIFWLMFEKLTNNHIEFAICNPKEIPSDTVRSISIVVKQEDQDKAVDLLKDIQNMKRNLHSELDPISRDLEFKTVNGKLDILITAETKEIEHDIISNILKIFKIESDVIPINITDIEGFDGEEGSYLRVLDCPKVKNKRLSLLEEYCRLNWIGYFHWDESDGHILFTTKI